MNSFVLQLPVPLGDAARLYDREVAANLMKVMYTLDGVDLSAMDTHGIRFVGCAIRGVKWPQGAGMIIVPECKRALPYVREWLRAHPSDPRHLMVRLEFSGQLNLPPGDNAVYVGNMQTDVASTVQEVFLELARAAGGPAPIEVDALPDGVAP